MANLKVTKEQLKDGSIMYYIYIDEKYVTCSSSMEGIEKALPAIIEANKAPFKTEVIKEIEI